MADQNQQKNEKRRRGRPKGAINAIPPSLYRAASTEEITPGEWRKILGNMKRLALGEGKEAVSAAKLIQSAVAPEVKSVELSGPEGAPIDTRAVPFRPEEMSDDELRHLASEPG